MTDYQYPSVFFPARPQFAVTVPDDWSPHLTDGVEFAVVRDAEEGDGGFRPNVSVTITRVIGEADLTVFATEIGTSLSEVPSVQILGAELREVLDNPGIRIEMTFPHPSLGEPIFQAINGTVIQHDLVADLITISGCCTVEQSKELLATIREIVESARLE
ncbi:hypothetical protein [Leifsonia sp. Leaf264]|uniref:hypothetical protein n=1 Tax=Leifsonia sp. Leaf264 TaxID=1736314 RepID=UPI0012F9B639|nr:hypothetical protein [Leifsonia sp. Leaf264]